MMTRRIVAIALIILGLLSWIFLKDYSGKFIPYPSLLGFIGLITFLFGIYLLWNSTSKVKLPEFDMLQQIEDLKLNGEKIKVEFSKCEIKSNGYTEERERYSDYRIQAWNVLAGDSDKNVELVDINQSRIIFHHEINGNTETFISGIIPKDQITLSFELDEKKETTLYVDRNNRENFYFDLEFLIRP